MKKTNELPPILQGLYLQYIVLDKSEKGLKAKKAQKKAQIMAWLKKEQTDGFTVKGKKLIHLVDKAGSVTIDKPKLQRLFPAAYLACYKRGNDSKALLIKE